MSAPGEAAASGTGGDASLGRRTVNAAQWQMASSATKGILQFGVTILLARLLTPVDFGLVALAMVVVGFAEMVVDLGFGPALVQRDELTPRHVRASFTLSTLVGLAATLLLLLAAPVLALLLRNPAVTDVLRWMSGIFLFAGLAATARAVLQRALDFRGLFFVSLFGYGVGYAGVAVTLALLGFGVWSLVWGALAQSVVACAAALLLTRHSLVPLLSRAELKDLFDFGLGVMLNRVVVYVSFHGDNLVVGRWLGPAALGLYSRAFQLMLLPLTHLGSITWGVLFSAYSRLQGDRERLSAAYLKGVQLTSLVVAPVMAGMVVAGPHLVVGLYGEQWIAATLPLQVLCAAGLFRAVFAMTGALTHATGAVYAELKRQAVYAALILGGGLAGTAWGLPGVALGVAGAIACNYAMMAQVGVSLSGCGWRGFFGAQLPGVLLGLWVAAAAGAARLLLEGRGMASEAVLAGVVLACAAAVPAGIFLMPERLRPRDLFRSLAPSLARLPAALRLPLHRVLRVAPEGLHAPS